MSTNGEKVNTVCRNVLICGAYGANNIGDEAMLKAVLIEMRALVPEARICVVTRAPQETKELYGVDAVFTFDLPALHREMKKADVYVLGGGSLIQNVTSRRSLRYYLGTIRMAKKCGCKVLMYGCGIGPVNYDADRRLTAKVMNACVDAVSLRDPQSMALLQELGIDKPEIVLAADPVLSLDAEDTEEAKRIMDEAGFEEDKKYICFAIREWQGLEDKKKAILGAVRMAYEELGLVPVFLPMNYRVDLEVSKAFAAASGVPAIVLPELKTAEAVLGVMSRMELTVSMRLHAILFAATAGVPAVAVSYDPKVSAFVEYSKCGQCIELDELNYESLAAAIAEELGGAGSGDLAYIKSAEKKNSETAAKYMGL